MFKPGLRDRIAFHYMVAAGAIFLVVFLLLYAAMHRTVYSHLDRDLYVEARGVIRSVAFLNQQIIFTDESEWQEKEHKQADVNPMFLQVITPNGAVIRKSPNLEGQSLSFDPKHTDRRSLNATISNSAVRQLQLPLQGPEGTTLGYLLVAMPRQEAENVLTNLHRVLIAAFPGVLLVVFFTSRWIARRTISPVERITATAEQITSRTLNERVELPPNQDELFRLATTINELLERLQNAMLRERQFTEDASHELRTPLAALKGTLEVLIRKQRTPQEYEEKAQYCIMETQRLADLVDHLLLLARSEANQVPATIAPCDLREVVESATKRVGPLMTAWRTKAILPETQSPTVSADRNLLEVMIQNLLSNAVKYSPEGSTIEITWSSDSLQVRDHGIGISDEMKPRIFNRFFRGDLPQSSGDGAGLGLSIVKRLADLQHLDVSVKSEPDGGTTFEIHFAERP